MTQREIKFQLTNRGFAYIEFEDKYGLKCSLQKSSAAFVDCIWFGVDNVSIIASKEAEGIPIKIDQEAIKKVFNVDIVTNSRMHLTREQVAALLPILQKFVETGEVENPELLTNNK
jgi:hypothetical protein